MLDKLGGVFAPKPSCGPHKTRECLPLILILRNRLKYALTRREVSQILLQRLVKIDHKVRTDKNYPVGFMDIVGIQKTDENFRLLYDTKGRFVLQRLTNPEEAKFKLGKVKRAQVGPKGIPYVTLHDGRTIRYPDPSIKVNDSVKYSLETGKIQEFVKFDVGNLVMITGGKNLGRVGVITNKEKHPGSFDIVHVKDAAGSSFATRVTNVFVIGKGTKSLVTLPRGKGIKRTILEDSQVAASKKDETKKVETKA